MKSYCAEDGRWHHRFRQSWLKSAMRCLEYARREHFKLMPRWETDAAAVGTAVHSAIETCLAEYHSDGVPLDEGTTLEVFNDEFTARMQRPEWRWVKYKEVSARRFGTRCVEAWYAQVLPTLPPEGTLEHHFCKVLLENDKRVIELSGTIDYIGNYDRMEPGDPPLKDWKTSGGMPWVKWEHERWDIQPTVYTWAAELPYVTSDHAFEFVIMDGKGVERMTVHRTPGDWSWLQRKCEEIAYLIEQELHMWPTNDTHALCSPKWCPAWDTCKGAHVSAGWPKGA